MKSHTPTRRDVLHVASNLAGLATVGVWPARAQTFTNAKPVIVALSAIAPGQEIVVVWSERPIIIRRRTDDEIQRARDLPTDALVDTLARNAALPKNTLATDANRTHSTHPHWLVLTAICTHLACRVSPAAETVGGDGWFCRCHAARFDILGRVVSGPAYENLAVPPYRFLSGDRLEIGRA